MLPSGTKLIPDNVIATLQLIPQLEYPSINGYNQALNNERAAQSFGGLEVEPTLELVTTLEFPTSTKQTSDVRVQAVGPTGIALGISPPPPQPPRFIIAPTLGVTQPSVSIQQQPQPQLHVNVQPQAQPILVPAVTIPPRAMIQQQPIATAVSISWKTRLS